MSYLVYKTLVVPYLVNQSIDASLQDPKKSLYESRRDLVSDLGPVAENIQCLVDSGRACYREKTIARADECTG